MKIHCLCLAVAVGLVASLPAAMAQTSASAPVPGASAPSVAKAGRRALTPAELRANAAPPDDLRPEGPVVPQLSIPLGKPKPGPVKPKLRAMRPNPAASSGGVNDTAARCEAEADESARAQCRDSLVHPGRTR